MGAATGIGLAPSDEQHELRMHARRFAERELRPRAQETERTGVVPRDLIELAAEAGLSTFSLPERVGGGGLDAVTSALVNEELAWGDAGLATLVGSAQLFAGGIMSSTAADEQQDRWLELMCREGGALGAIAFSEPHAGSDVAALRTSARRDGDSWILSGEKTWITAGGIADATLVFARTGTDGAAGLSAFVVLAGDEGVDHRRLELLGLRSSYTSSIFLDEVRLPADRLLGEEGDGFATAMRFFTHSRPQVAASAVGIARAAFEHAVAYANEREAFGRPIMHRQGVSFQLAEVGMRIDAARLLVWQACDLLDRGLDAGLAASYAKAFAADVAMQATTTAVQVLGAAGLDDEHPTGRWMRDAKVLQVVEGTSEVQRLICSRYYSAGVTSTQEALTR